MQASVGWFIALASASVLAAVAGVHLGRTPRWRSDAWLIVGLALLAWWAWLLHHPAVAVRLLPLSVLAYLEGTGAVPIFMLVLGIAWARSRLFRQRRLVLLGGVVGAVYFLHGGMWMLQPTPVTGLSHAVQRQPRAQSLDFTCGPAAAATALNLLGVYSSEAEMVQLTHTRPGSGTTLIRTMYGLSQRLQTTPYRVELICPDQDQLHTLPLPAVTALQFEPTRRHMVTILSVLNRGVLVADPIDGTILIPHEAFQRLFCGEVLIFPRQ